MYHSKRYTRDFPGDPVAKTALPMQGAQVQFLVREFSSVQSLCCVLLFMIPWMAVRQASLFITNSWNLLKFTSIESNHFILCHPLLLTPSIFPSNRVFSNESVLPIRWKVSGFQLQHHSFQRVFRTDFL